MKKLLPLLLSLLLILPLAGYGLNLKRLSPRDGLSNRRVWMSAKDSDGYLWFATRTGIDRYNGSEITNYRLTDDNGEILYPRGVISDTRGNIYAYTEHALYRYRPEQDRFVALFLRKSPQPEAINLITLDPSGNMWIGTTKNLYRFDPEDLHSEVIFKNCPSIHTLTFDDRNHGWAGTAHGIWEITGADTPYCTLSRREILSPLEDKRIQILYYDPLTQYLWIGSFSDGLFRYNPLREELDTRHSAPRQNPIRTITTIGKNRLWIGCDGGGIYEFNRFECTLLTRFSQQQKGFNHIWTNNIYHIRSFDNSVCICTYTGGVFLYKENHFVTDTFINNEYSTQSLRNNHVNVIREDRLHRLWFGTNQGISRFDPKTRQWKHLLDQGIILALTENSEGEIWAGGYACDPVKIDKQDRVTKINLSQSSDTNDQHRYIYNIYEDHDGMIWIGGLINPLTRYNPHTRQFSYYPILGIHQCLQWRNRMLIASNKGVLSLDPRDGSSSYLSSSKNPGLLSTNIQQIHIIPTHPDELWIGTESSGVIRYDLSSGRILRHYTIEDGLSSESICSMLSDPAHRLWVGTEIGLSCIDPQNDQIRVYYAQDGLLTNTQNLQACTSLRNGRLIFGSPSGAVEINPAVHNESPQQIYNLRFEEFALFNVPLSPGEEHSPLKTLIDKTEQITLKHDQHSFSFRFLNIGQSNTFKNRYCWYLEGFDEGWCLPTDHHHAVYTNIPPGRYTFRVKVYSRGNENHFQERSIRIIIRRPWWNTPWAWICYVLLAAAILRELNKAYKNRMEARDSDQKIRFFINLAHDIRTPLTLIKAPLNEIGEEPLSENGRTALDLAQRNTDKLQNMVTQLLDFQKIEREVMSLQTEETPINRFVFNAISNFEPLARERGISLHTLLPDEETACYIDRRKLTIILDNLLSNSIKYSTEGGNVWIKSHIDNGMLSLEIIDDGIGISEHDQSKLFNRFYRGENAINSKETGSGIGLLLTKKMTKLHKGTIEFSSCEGRGTTFLIRLPIRRENYSKHEIIAKDVHHPCDTPHNEESETRGRIKLLIVEDNEELRAYLSHYFAQYYHILESPDGQAALETIRKENPDFIISDIMMPHLSGLELCRQLKAQIETCHIPIILLTSLAEREDIINGLHAGADDYITKPFDLPVLKSKIATILNNRRLFHRKFIDKSAFDEQADTINELDRKFMARVVDYIEEKMMCEDFSIDNLAMEMAMSRSVFFKKIKSLTERSPQDFIRDVKMKQAVTLLSEHKYSIGEIAYLTGYPNAKYFSTAFKKYYGKSPSTYFDNMDENPETEV